MADEKGKLRKESQLVFYQDADVKEILDSLPQGISKTEYINSAVRFYQYFSGKALQFFNNQLDSGTDFFFLQSVPAARQPVGVKFIRPEERVTEMQAKSFERDVEWFDQMMERLKEIDHRIQLLEESRKSREEELKKLENPQ